MVGAPPPELGFLAPTVPFDTLYDRVINYVTYTAQINATGLPAMSVPLGMSSGGLPIGSQFVSGAGNEAMLFELA